MVGRIVFSAEDQRSRLLLAKMPSLDYWSGPEFVGVVIASIIAEIPVFIIANTIEQSFEIRGIIGVGVVFSADRLAINSLSSGGITVTGKPA